MSENENHTDDDDFDAEALAALARPSARPPAPAEDDEGEEDDDAVVDLRALASSSIAPPAGEPEEDEPEQDEHEEDEAPATAAPKAASSKAASSKKPAKAEPAPVQATPAPAQEKSGGSGMIIGVLIGAVIAAGAVFALGGGDSSEPTAANNPPTASAPATTAAAAPSVAEPSVAEPSVEEPSVEEPSVEEPGVEQPGVEEPGVEEPGVEGPDAGSTSRRPRRRSTAAPSETPEAAAAPEVAPEPTPPPTMATVAPAMEESASTMERNMDDLLNSALGGQPAMGGAQTVATMTPAATMADPNLPDTPSRSAVSRALGGLMGQIRRCAGDQVGLANARIRVRNDGTVASVSIAGSPFGGTPQGACMERVVRQARFPRFRRSNFDITFPFSVRPLN